MYSAFHHKKIIVTGGAGFIGSHIVEGLLKQDSHITVIDNLSTGRIENIECLPQRERLEFIQGSITDLPLLHQAFSGVEYVFHQAAIPSVPRSIENPIDSHDANITGTLNVLLASRDARVKKVIFASSSSVYGDTPVLPKHEEMIPNPLSPYALTKLAAEYYCGIFTRVYGLPTVCLRYFNVYGPRQNPDSQYSAVIPKFIKQILRGNPPVIYGDGEQSRDFTFVKDVASANFLTALKPVTGVFNIGTGERITLNQLTGLMFKHLHVSGIKPSYEKERQGDIKHSLADITKARGYGYCPEYKIEKGVIETIRSFTNGQ